MALNALTTVAPGSSDASSSEVVHPIRRELSELPVELREVVVRVHHDPARKGRGRQFEDRAGRDRDGDDLAEASRFRDRAGAHVPVDRCNHLGQRVRPA
jgi:hypothetical protein